MNKISQKKNTMDEKNSSEEKNLSVLLRQK